MTSHPDNCIDHLKKNGMTMLFEERTQPLAQQLQSLTFTPDNPPPPRIALLQALLQHNSVDQLVGFYTLFLAENDLEACCACVGGALSTIWKRGTDFKSYAPWLELSENLLKHLQSIPPLAASYLLLQQGIAEITGPGDLTAAEQSFNQQRQQAELSGSTSLQVLGAAMHAYCFIWSAKLVRAELALQRVIPLLSDPQLCKFCFTHYQIILAMTKTIQGDPQQAIQILKEVINQPLFLRLSPFLQLRIFNFLLNAQTVADNLTDVEEVATQVRGLAVPEQNNFHCNYLHFCLGAVALATGRPHKANIHVEEAALRAAACGSVIALNRTALLQGRVLTDLGHNDEALRHFETWDKRWMGAGHHLISALGRLETSAIYLRRGVIDRARIHWDRAHEFVPEGEKIFHLFRPRDFYNELEKKLSQEPEIVVNECHNLVCISTLEHFSLTINGEKFYDRNWKGRQTKDLLKTLIVFGGEKVSIEKITSLIWPDADGDQAQNSFYVALSRLRKVGATNGHKPPYWLASQHKKLSFINNLCSVDALVFHKRIKKALRTPADSELLPSALELYYGNFLPNDTNYSWINNFRDELLHLYVKGVLCQVENFSLHQETDAAIELLETAIKHEPVNETLYWELMQRLFQNNKRGEALDIYQHAVQNLSDQFNIEPSPALQKLARKIHEH